nr:hypothetical protein CFP56_41233 [Quercus suber]
MVDSTPNTSDRGGLTFHGQLPKSILPALHLLFPASQTWRIRGPGRREMMATTAENMLGSSILLADSIGRKAGYYCDNPGAIDQSGSSGRHPLLVIMRLARCGGRVPEWSRAVVVRYGVGSAKYRSCTAVHASENYYSRCFYLGLRYLGPFITLVFLPA